MELTISISEDKLREKVAEATADIENNVWYEVRKGIVDKLAQELQGGITERDYWGKEKMVAEIEQRLIDKIDATVKGLIEKRLEEYKLKQKVDEIFDMYVRDMINTKAEKVISKLMVVSAGEGDDEYEEQQR